jgi:hypothetical protein
MNLYEFDDRILKERNGRKPIYVNKHLAKDLKTSVRVRRKTHMKWLNTCYLWVLILLNTMKNLRCLLTSKLFK